MNHKKQETKGRRKRLLAAALAALTAFCFVPSATPAATKAASPYVSLRTRFKTLQVGQKNRMTLKNNTVGWKVTKVATSDRTVAMVYGKTEQDFFIKGKSVGRATVKARLKTTARKKFSTKLVKCRVNVTAPSNPADEAVTDASVSTQAELEKALSNKQLKKLSIQTKDAQTFTIPAGNYKNVALTVDAPAADVVNNGVFSSITIQAIKSDTWFENAIGNVMDILAETARIVVNKGARLNRMNLSRVNAKVSLEVNGAIDEVSIQAKMELSITGKPEAPVNVTVEASAEGAKLTSEAPVNITAYASVDITLNKGAENSTVTVKSKDADVKVTNKTSGTITITKADGTVERKSSGLINLSSGSHTRPPATVNPSTPSTPDIVTGPAIDTETPTGPSISDDGYNDGGNTGGSTGGGGGNIGGIGDVPFPTASNFIDVFAPKAVITISRSAIQTTSSAITMSAIFTYQFNKDNLTLSKPGQIRWSCHHEMVGVDQWTEESKEVNMQFDQMGLSEIGDLFADPSTDYMGVDVDMQFDFSQNLIFDDTYTMVIFERKVLEEYVSHMEEQGWTEMTLELPLTVVHEKTISYKFDESYIMASGKE